LRPVARVRDLEVGGSRCSSQRRRGTRLPAADQATQHGAKPPEPATRHGAGQPPRCDALRSAGGLDVAAGRRGRPQRPQARHRKPPQRRPLASMLPPADEAVRSCRMLAIVSSHSAAYLVAIAKPLPIDAGSG
jgi:hypothetical protein